MTYGAEVVIPLETGFPTLKTSSFSPNSNDNLLESALDLIEERRENAMWYRFESVGWIIRLRWDYRRWWKAYKEGNSQRGDRRWPAKPPPMRKLVWNSKCFGVFLFKRFLTPVLFRPALYIGTFGAVISSITSPRFSEACEFGDNFLNGWKLLMEINCSKNFGRQSCIY